jgi:predicted DNA-binding transcriptional regulator YafY
MDPDALSTKTARLFSLINELVNTNRGVSPETLAQKYRITPRTVSRYLRVLKKDLELPLTAEFRGKRRYYRIRGNVPFFKGMDFSEQELEVLNLSRQLFKLLYGTHFQEGMDSLFRKLENFFPANLKEKAEQAVRFFPGPVMNLRPFADQIAAVAQGIRRRRKVRMVYASKSGGRIAKDYVIHPYAIIIHGSGLYFFGKRDDNLTFRVWAAHRASVAKVLDREFPYDRNFSIDKHFEASFGIFQGITPREIVLKVRGEALKEIKEMAVYRKVKRVFTRNREMVLTLHVMGFEDIRKFILAYCNEIEVVSPPEFRREMAGILRTAAKLYQ